MMCKLHQTPSIKYQVDTHDYEEIKILSYYCI
jgi:hypothetical protein